MLGRLARALLIFAVLLAQQTAIAHQYWHASSASLGTDAKKAPKGDRLCGLHDLLGTVLGVASGAAPTPAFLDLADIRYAAPAAVGREAPPFAPHSRDPPLIS